MQNDKNVVVAYQNEDKLSIWKWYFGWHPRIFITVLLFLLFVYQGLWFTFAGISDIASFFQTQPTWGSILMVLIFGPFLLTLIFLPAYVCFYSISGLYEIAVGNYTPWKKFLYTILIVFLVFLGAGIIRLLTAWIFGIL